MQEVMGKVTSFADSGPQQPNKQSANQTPALPFRFSTTHPLDIFCSRIVSISLRILNEYIANCRRTRIPHSRYYKAVKYSGGVLNLKAHNDRFE